MKVIFMGTPDFAMESLKALNEEGYEILSVVTNPDRPKGRGMKLIASPERKYRIYRRIEKSKSRCYMCCSLWKIVT